MIVNSEIANFRVLVVEDNEDDARLIAEYLRQHDGRALVHTADRLEAARTFLQMTPVDLILLDLSLPDGHGINSVHRLLTGAPGIPIIVLTGLDDERLAAQAVQAGARDYINKNHLDSKLLARAVRCAIERHRPT